MTTPILDFVHRYTANAPVRFHMPGHKGEVALGCEPLDLTEIEGADDLGNAKGIIAESEQNATDLFGTAHTFYSTGGATHAIKAMLALATSGCERPRLLSARNAHKAFLYAAALLDADVTWLYDENTTHLCRCHITPDILDKALNGAEKPYHAVYVTSPDYLGNVQDIAALASVAHAHGTKLLVDNAHGAYLAFCTPSRHPIALGADLCADSAHKTLPVLTGGAYLHVSKRVAHLVPDARRALSLFGTTSPSYLVLQSLDLCNRILADGYAEKIQNTAKRVQKLRHSLQEAGYVLTSDEPLKLAVSGLSRGYTGHALAAALRGANVEVEFADDTLVVLMCTPHNDATDFARVANVLTSLESRESIEISHTVTALVAKRCCSVRHALFAAHERVSTQDALGRICASPSVSCPPAVPIVASGERITKEAISLFAAYDIEEIDVLKEK